MRKLAMKSGTKRTDLGYMLDLESTDVDQMLCKYSDPTDQAFRILLVSHKRYSSLPAAVSFDFIQLNEYCIFLGNLLQLL